MRNASGPEILTFDSPEALAHGAADWFIQVAQESVHRDGVFRVALSGGSTPRSLFRVLASPALRDRLPCDQSQIFFSDERFVPLTSDESNYRMAQRELLSKVPINDRFTHPVVTEDVSPEDAADLYAEGIRRVFGVASDEIPHFDLILLGLGPDGHTASLFPGSDALDEETKIVAPNYVSKMDAWRITFTYPLINAARRVAFLVQGADKADRVAEVMRRVPQLPASRVVPADGELTWLLDTAAAARISNGSTEAHL